MDFLNFSNGNEAFSVWENVKESVKALSIKSNSKVSLDCSFVTPSILGKVMLELVHYYHIILFFISWNVALARFDDEKAEELSVLLNGNNVMLWNLR